MGFIRLIIILLIFASISFAQEENKDNTISTQTEEIKQSDNLIIPEEEGYRIYVVQKGDTLWDITHNILKEPFLWPKVWNANPEIKNPDLIYPGQKIKIPISVLKEELAQKREEMEIRPEEIKKVEPPVGIEERKKTEEDKREIAKTETPVIETMFPEKKEYLADLFLVLASGYISKTIPDDGTIIGSPSGREIFGKGDHVYIKTLSNNKGDRFYIINPVSKVKHPDTKDYLGYLIEIKGIIEITGKESGYTKAVITESFSEIYINDKLQTFYLIEPVLKPENPLYPKINGCVVATRHLNTTSGFIYDVIYIDKGSKDGITTGSIINALSRSHPRIQIGQVQVINVREETSTAIVIKSLKEIVRGDRVINE